MYKIKYGILHNREVYQMNKTENQKISPMRKLYWLRLVGRCLVLIISVALLIFRPEAFDPLKKGGFFKNIV